MRDLSEYSDKIWWTKIHNSNTGADWNLEDGGEAAVAPTLPSLTVLYNSTVSTSERGAFLLQCLTINKELVLGERL